MWNERLPPRGPQCATTHFPVTGVEWRQCLDCRFGLSRHAIVTDLPRLPMDSSRFDALYHALTAAGSRRLTLGMLLGEALGLRGLPGVQAKRKSGRCQPRCPECEKCNKGSCQRKNGKKVCKKGKCKAKPAGTPCSAFPDGACQNGTCVNLQADEANCGSVGMECGPTQVCQAGTCFPRSTCPATLTVFCPAIFGTPCGSSCSCNQSSEGNIVCVDLAVSFCAPPSGTATPCTTSAICPPGSACVDTSGCCGAPGIRTCVPRCPAPVA
jgi:hypothetical protein